MLKATCPTIKTSRSAQSRLQTTKLKNRQGLSHVPVSSARSPSLSWDSWLFLSPNIGLLFSLQGPQIAHQTWSLWRGPMNRTCPPAWVLNQVKSKPEESADRSGRYHHGLDKLKADRLGHFPAGTTPCWNWIPDMPLPSNTVGDPSRENEITTLVFRGPVIPKWEV